MNLDEQVMVQAVRQAGDVALVTLVGPTSSVSLRCPAAEAPEVGDQLQITVATP